MPSFGTDICILRRFIMHKQVLVSMHVMWNMCTFASAAPFRGKPDSLQSPDDDASKPLLPTALFN